MLLSNEGLFSSATSAAALFQVVRSYPVNQMQYIFSKMTHDWKYLV